MTSRPWALRAPKFRPRLSSTSQVIACFLPLCLTHNTMPACFPSPAAFYCPCLWYEMKAYLAQPPRGVGELWEEKENMSTICQESSWAKTCLQQRQPGPVRRVQAQFHQGLLEPRCGSSLSQAKQSLSAVCNVSGWLGAKPISSFLPSQSAEAHSLQKQLPCFLLSRF